jgi:hypothetical protein
MNSVSVDLSREDFTIGVHIRNSGKNIVINSIMKRIRTDQWKTKPENSISLAWHVNPLVINMLKQKKHCYYNYPRDRKNPIMRSKDFQQM